MIISLIAAIDRNYAIGRDNDLPWRLPDDLKRFKALTLGRPMLMGRKTAESLGRALPGRENLVLTRTGRVPFEGMTPVSSLDEAFDVARRRQAGELCVIGGGEVFSLCLPHATHLRMTYVDTCVENADAYFPRFDVSQWRETSREFHAADAKHAFSFEFVDYER
ncbi:dihydrofolate reductase [Lysobacter korlensis]|uniref:Dihydrofolate reductase n=1 Tax=Lysobacter korlensis TaxID=553636 RepID=A0ABV6RLB4_9GAMM